MAILEDLPNFNFCHLGIFQIVLCVEMAVGGGAGVVGFFCIDANFCYWWNISDVIIPFISWLVGGTFLWTCFSDLKTDLLLSMQISSHMQSVFSDLSGNGSEALGVFCGLGPPLPFTLTTQPHFCACDVLCCTYL